MLNVITHRLRSGSITIQQFVDKTRHISNEAIRTAFVTNIVLAVNLVLLVSALVLLIWHWPLGFIIFAEGTCLSLDDFQQNPQNNSLQIILPCAKSGASDKILVQIGFAVHNSLRRHYETPSTSREA